MIPILFETLIDCGQTESLLFLTSKNTPAHVLEFLIAEALNQHYFSLAESIVSHSSGDIGNLKNYVYHFIRSEDYNFDELDEPEHWGEGFEDKPHARVIEFLLHHGANVNWVHPEEQKTPLDLARELSYEEAEHVILEYGGKAFSDLTNNEKQSIAVPLVEVCLNHSLPAIQECLAQSEVFEIQAAFNQLCLLPAEACTKVSDFKKRLSMLCDGGAHPNIGQFYRDDTPFFYQKNLLFHIVRGILKNNQKDLTILKYLIGFGAEINLINQEHSTLLDLAVNGQHHKLVQLLTTNQAKRASEIRQKEQLSTLSIHSLLSNPSENDTYIQNYFRLHSPHQELIDNLFMSSMWCQHWIGFEYLVQKLKLSFDFIQPQMGLPWLHYFIIALHTYNTCKQAEDLLFSDSFLKYIVKSSQNKELRYKGLTPLDLAKKLDCKGAISILEG